MAKCTSGELKNSYDSHPSEEVNAELYKVSLGGIDNFVSAMPTLLGGHVGHLQDQKNSPFFSEEDKECLHEKTVDALPALKESFEKEVIKAGSGKALEEKLNTIFKNADNQQFFEKTLGLRSKVIQQRITGPSR